MPKQNFPELPTLLASFDKETVEIIQNCLEIDQEKRITIEELYESSYFTYTSRVGVKKSSPKVRKPIKKLNLSKITKQPTYLEIHKRKISPDPVRPSRDIENSQTKLRAESFFTCRIKESNRLPKLNNIEIIKEKKSDFLDNLSFNIHKSSFKRYHQELSLNRNLSNMHNSSNESLSSLHYDKIILTHRSFRKIERPLDVNAQQNSRRYAQKSTILEKLKSIKTSRKLKIFSPRNK